MSDDPLLARIIPVIAAVSGVAAIVLGGSRARGTAHDTSDTDIGLYYRDGAAPDIDRLREAVTGLVDDPAAAHVTPVGEWDRGSSAVPGSRSAAARSTCSTAAPIRSLLSSMLAGTARSACTTSRAIRTASARRSGWARSRCAISCTIPTASSRR
ncbi:nucleotidyltransferase domain-containing protein [Bradyrhizobium brasilense]|uniref:Nucleotidyltransferase domain-containing protein n=1 Tax=Bradyrhizobium brasilense TaxID=1419277 RepID=A0ABY8JAD8_9BRAD|nr:nucleotidyltransferase domain-containing protein [Bradyrhizobium brasilense]WFU62144.1 nucleotidyltransferase domain-containing protein [Bradyrhizobium brasilense]